MFKRLIFFLILFMGLRLHILAEVQYSEYSPFSEWQEEEVVSNDLTDVEIETRYKWYKENRVDGGYYIKDYNDPFYPFIDKPYFKITPFTSFSEEQPTIYPNRIIDKKNIYHYRKMKEVRYIYLKNTYSPVGYLGIPELNILVNDERINYDYECDHCSDNYGNYINDNNIYQDGVYIQNGAVLKFDLKDYYDASTIKINLYLYDSSLSNKQYDIILSPYDNLTEPQYFYQTFNQNFICNSIEEVKQYTYKLDNSWLKEPEWYDWQDSEVFISPSLTTEVLTKTLYRYRDIIYLYYRIEHLFYDDNYYKDSPDIDYHKDLNQYKNYYRYRTRTMLEDNPIEEDINDSVMEDNSQEETIVIEPKPIQEELPIVAPKSPPIMIKPQDIVAPPTNVTDKPIEVIPTNNDKVTEEPTKNESPIALNIGKIKTDKDNINYKLYILGLIIIVGLWLIIIVKYYREQKL